MPPALHLQYTRSLLRGSPSSCQTLKVPAAGESALLLCASSLPTWWWAPPGTCCPAAPPPARRTAVSYKQGIL